MQSVHLLAFRDERETVFSQKVHVICSLSGPLQGTRNNFSSEGLRKTLTFGSTEQFSGPLRRAPERFFGRAYARDNFFSEGPCNLLTFGSSARDPKQFFLGGATQNAHFRVH